MPESIAPNAVLVNPPFSSSGGRVERNQNKFGFRHVESALRCLESGGQFAVILGEGGSPRSISGRRFWASILPGIQVTRSISLPAPSLIHRDLLTEETTWPETERLEALSCPERIRLGEQSLNINQRVAVEMADVLTAMFLTRTLKRFASYFDLESGTSRSLYCTPEHIALAIRRTK